MTKEQVLINHIQEYLDSGMWQYEACYLNKDDLKVIIKALEQEPCEDAISRKTVLEQTYNWSKDEFLRVTNPFDYLRKRINSLPPVIPQPKTGHWIPDVDRWGDVVTTVNGYRCDKCNAFNSDKDNYCPNCGCRMKGSE